MITLRWLTGLALLSFYAYGQGMVVVSNDFVPPGSTTKAYVRDLWTGPISSEYGRVEVVGQDGVILNSGKFISDGIFSLFVEIPGTFPGGSATFVLRVWDSRSGSAYSEASYRASAEIIVNGLGGGTIPAPPLSAVGNFTGLSLGVLTPIGPDSVGIMKDETGEVRVRANALAFQPLRVWSSTDMSHWVEAGPAQLVPPGEFVDWHLPSSEPGSFFRVMAATWEPSPSP